MSMKFAITAGVFAGALAMLTGAALAADATGSVSVTGFVNGKCTVQPPSEGNNFSGTIPLGALDGTNGHISSTLTGSTISGASLSFTVVCNSSAPSITLSATQMGDSVAAPTGYTSAVDYTARLDLAETTGSEAFTYATAGSPPATAGALANPLSGGTNNVTVSVNSLNTDGGANTSILTAGNYGSAAGGTGGIISVTIAP